MSKKPHWAHLITISDAKRTSIVVCTKCDLAYDEYDFEKSLELNGCLKCGNKDFEKKILLSESK